MIEFRQAKHTQKPTDIVEVWVDGKMLAVIYPNGGDGIKVISRHIVEGPTVEHDVATVCSFRFKEQP